MAKPASVQDEILKLKNLGLQKQFTLDEERTKAESEAATNGSSGFRSEDLTRMLGLGGKPAATAMSKPKLRFSEAVKESKSGLVSGELLACCAVLTICVDPRAATGD